LVGTSLRKFIGNGKDILLKGKQKKIQIWDEKKYGKMNETNRSEAEQLSAEVAKYLDELEGEEK
jgi:DNA-binding transcriptional regulator/RsmH inhibitor MraZ